MKIESKSNNQIEGLSAPAIVSPKPNTVANNPARNTLAKPKRAASTPEIGPKTNPATA